MSDTSNSSRRKPAWPAPPATHLAPEKGHEPGGATLGGRSVDAAGNAAPALAIPDSDDGSSNPQEPEVSPDDLTVVTGRRPDGPIAGGPQSSSELGRQLIGQRLGHFVLEEFVGCGGMGAVFRGTDTMLGRTVAVKVLSLHHAEDEETTRRFRNEAQSAARLDHENIARVYYVGVDRGWHYIVLEFIDGQNVRDLVQQHGPLSVEDVIGYTLQVAEALAHASGRDVVHRDIKPSNVLVTQDKRAKLVDMGLARLHQVEHSAGDLTASGVTLGTFDYISPEQARDPRAADVRSDLYSLGCTMYYMLCGRPPFPEGTVLQKLLQHQGDEAPDPRQLRNDLPDELAEIVRKLLAKNPQHRYQNPRELIGELLLLSDQLGLPSPGGRPAVWIAPRSGQAHWYERHLPWLVPLGLLLLIVLGVQIFGTSSADIAPPWPHAKNAAPAASRGKRAKPALSPPRVKDNSPATPGADRPIVAPTDGSAQNAGHGTAEPETTPDRGGNRPDAATVARSTGGAADTGSTPPRTDTGGSGETARQPMLEPGTSKPDMSPALIVASTPKGERSFSSLAEACRQAPSGSVIELRYNGRRDEQPMLLSNSELTIRAGDGFRPIVHFRPDGSDPLLYPRAMVSVRGGDLTLVNVELELEIPQVVRADRWALFETVLADKVRLERSTLTILNAGDDASAYHQDVSFFYVKAAPRREAGMMAESPMPDPRLEIELRDCIVRGEATLLTGNALHTVSLRWENGLLATSERLLSVPGGHSIIPAASQLQLDLQHVTALMRRGMCLMATREDERILPPVRINCTDCILMTDAAPLVEQRGDDSVEEQQKLLSWKGSRNFYEGFAIFWRIESSPTLSPVELDWPAWRDHWGTSRESTERAGAVIFKHLPQRQRNVSAHVPSDYALDDRAPHNPALGSATDGTADVGLKAELLPSLPEPAAVPPPPAKEPAAAAAGEDDDAAKARPPSQQPEEQQPSTDATESPAKE